MRQKRKGVVYSGRVGNMSKPPRNKFCSRQRVNKTKISLRGGPMDGHAACLADISCTLPFTMKGQTGRYVLGKNAMVWQPAGGV